MKAISPEKHAARLALWGQGMSDREIAAELGLRHSAIYSWRKLHELAANSPGTPAKRIGRLSKADHADRLALYRLGHSDTSIAKLRGLTRATVAAWRRQRGLPARHVFQENNGGKVRLDDATETRRMARYRLGWTDVKIAEEEGVSWKRIEGWRRCRGLVGNGKATPYQRPSIVSMDADLGEGGFNRHALIADDAAAAWLEEMGATRWE